MLQKATDWKLDSSRDALMCDPSVTLINRIQYHVPGFEWTSNKLKRGALSVPNLLTDVQYLP